jgi:farnesyl-diphosphate farnesyltransferase
MTNILKDIWDDRQADTCWLPRAVFEAHGFDLDMIEARHESPEFAAGLRDLVGVAHGHLRNALEYSLIIPASETGIRKFCLWAIGLAVLTLRKISRNPSFRSGADVKVTRRTVKATILATNLALRSDRALRLVFNRAADGLPLVSPESTLVRSNYGPTPEAS